MRKLCLRLGGMRVAAGASSTILSTFVAEKTTIQLSAVSGTVRSA
jgi:hypothetical protein